MKGKNHADTDGQKANYPQGSVEALCSAAMRLFALLIAFLGYTSFKSEEPWSWLDLFVLIIPAILAGSALISVPFFGIQERKTEAESIRLARRIFTLGSCLVVFVIFMWFIRDFIANHGQHDGKKMPNNSGVYRIGENTYHVATQATSELGGRVGAMRMAAQEATKYCSERGGKQLKVIKETDECGDFQGLLGPEQALPRGLAVVIVW